MATSGDTIYELTRDNIIAAAMRKCGALSKGQSPDSEDLTNGMQALNALMASWQGLGLTIWKQTELTVTLTTSQRDYTIGIGQTTNLNYPLYIETAWLFTTATGDKRELDIRSRSDFQQLNSSTTGTPTAVSYIPQVNKGFLSVWPKPDSTASSAYTIRLITKTVFEGFNSASETPDFPQEYQLALIYGLAVLIAPEFGVPLADRDMLTKEYSELTPPKDLMRKFTFNQTAELFVNHGFY
jgi:hypothetical protein